MPALQLERACSLLTRIPINHKMRDSWWFQSCICITDCIGDVINYNLGCIGVTQRRVGFFLGLQLRYSRPYNMLELIWQGKEGKKWILELKALSPKPGNATMGFSRLAWPSGGLCLCGEGCGAASRGGWSSAAGNRAQTQSCRLPNSFAGSGDLKLLWLKLALNRTVGAAVGTCAGHTLVCCSQVCHRTDNFLEEGL